MKFVGVDPGASGAIAVIDDAGLPISHIKNSNLDADLFRFVMSNEPSFGFIEKVHSMPGQGVASTFKFGASYGSLRMLLTCAAIPYEEVTPAKWQGVLGCRSKGDKNVTKRKAQDLFPTVRMTHAIADAYLIAEYCRRARLGL